MIADTVIKSESVSLIDLMRSGEISRQADAAPSTRPTEAAIWRTASAHSLLGAECPITGAATYPITGAAIAMTPSSKY